MQNFIDVSYSCQAMGALTPKSSAKTALSTNEEERTVNSKVGGSLKKMETDLKNRVKALNRKQS